MPELVDDPQAGHPEHAAPLCSGSALGGAGDLIREAGPADAAAIAAIHAASFEDRLEPNEIVGFLGAPGVLGLIAPDGFAIVRAAGDEAEVLWIAVAPNARRRGVAGALWEAAVQRFSELDVQRAFLEVAIDNHAALSFYSRLGFEEVGRRSAYYTDGRDALVLALDLARAGAAGQRSARDP